MTLLFFLRFYLFFERQSEAKRGSDREKKIFHLVVHFPNGRHSEGWTRLKSGGNYRNPGLSNGWQRPEHLLPCGLISRKLHQKQKSQNRNKRSQMTYPHCKWQVNMLSQMLAFTLCPSHKICWVLQIHNVLSFNLTNIAGCHYKQFS